MINRNFLGVHVHFQILLRRLACERRAYKRGSNSRQQQPASWQDSSVMTKFEKSRSARSALGFWKRRITRTEGRPGRPGLFKLRHYRFFSLFLVIIYNVAA